MNAARGLGSEDRDSIRNDCELRGHHTRMVEEAFSDPERAALAREAGRAMFHCLRCGYEFETDGEGKRLL